MAETQLFRYISLLHSCLLTDMVRRSVEYPAQASDQVQRSVMYMGFYSSGYLIIMFSILSVVNVIKSLIHTAFQVLLKRFVINIPALAVPG